MTTPPAAPPAGGVLDEVRRAIESLLGLARTRVELFAVELQEEKLRLIRLLLWLALALALLLAGVLLAIGTLGLFLWQMMGYPGLVLLAVVVLGAAAAILWALRRHLRTAPPPFAATTAEFARDAACLREK